MSLDNSIEHDPGEAAGVVLSPGSIEPPAPIGSAVPARPLARHRVSRFFGEPALVKRVLSLAWPVVLEQTLFAVVGLTDTYVVGHLGASSLAAVGLSNQIINLLAAVYGAVATGSMAVVARQIGAGERSEASKTTQQSILAAAVIGLALSSVSFIFAEQIMQALGAAADVVPIGAAYLRISSFTLILMPTLFVGNAIMRAIGDTRTPMQIMAVVVILNAGLAFWLVRGGPNLGANGSALAAMVARGVGGVLVLAMLLKGRGSVRLPREWPRLDWPRLKRVLGIGLPAGAEQLLLQSALIAMTTIITGLGTAAYAAHQIALNVMSMSYLPGWGFALAATTLVGQNLGAREYAQAKASGYTAFRLGLLVMVSMGVLLFIFDEILVRAFVPDDAAVIAFGVGAIRISAFIQPIMAASFVFSGGLRGAGDTRTALFITVGSTWLTRVPIAYVLAYTLDLDLNGAWLAIAADFLTRATFFWLRFRSGKWMTIKV